MENKALRPLKRLRDYDKTLPVLELYTAVQSEGSRQGYPTIVVRTTGCTHRCFFGEGGWCDSWYTTIHPEKGTITFNDIIKMYDDNPHISEMMLTGGSPTMHGKLVNELTHLAHDRNIVITIETEGSHFIATDYPIDLLSISPKFSNSVPVVGVETPQGRVTDERMIKQHNKFRLNYEAIKKSIEYHKDYHIKPVLDKDLTIVSEVEEFINDLEIPNGKIWAMPAGDDRTSLMESYPVVMNFVRDKGWRFTGRSHIMAFNTEREV